MSAAAGCVAVGAAQKTQPNGLRHNGGQYNIEHDRGTSVPISAQREQTVLFLFGKRGAIRRRGADSVPAGAAHVTAAQAGTVWQGPHELCGGGMAESLDDFAPLAVRRRSCRCARWSTLALETLTLSAPGAREAHADAHARLDAIRRDPGRSRCAMAPATNPHTATSYTTHPSG